MKKTIAIVEYKGKDEESFEIAADCEPGYKDGVLSFFDTDGVLIVIPLCNVFRIDVYEEDEDES